jgi:hypothetical protein
MEYISTLKLGRPVSLVVGVTDDYTAQGIGGDEIEVFLTPHAKVPVRKTGGYFVFTGLEDDICQVGVKSDSYLEETMKVELGRLDPANPVVYMNLKPAPSYRFPASATLIRASIFDSAGQAACGASIKAELLSEGCARARLTRNGAAAGSRELTLVDVAGRIAPGDIYAMKDREREETEVVTIAAAGVGNHVYQLEEDLKLEHYRGALLMPVASTRSDQRGEAVIALRNFRSKECEVQLEFSFAGRTKAWELTLEEGKTAYLGKIVL